MKKLFAMLFGALALNLSASQVYDIEQVWYTNEQNNGMGQGSYYLINLKQNSKIYLTDYLNNIYSGLQTETFKAMGITQYGYYLNGDLTDNHATSVDNAIKADNDDKLNSYSYWEEGADKPTYYNRNKYYLGDFKAGSTIEVWLSDGTTEVSSWTPVESAYTSRIEGRKDALNKDMTVAQLFMYNSTGYEVNFGLLTATSDLPIIQEGGGGTMGSPLPAPITTLLIACGLGGLLMISKRKQFAKGR